MPMGTAKKRLLKALIVSFAGETGVRCFVCDRYIDSPDDLAIEHLKPWRDDPSRFWDLSNVVLRHEHCARRPEREREMRLVQVIVEDNRGQHLDAYLHEGRLHVAGQEGVQYKIRVRNMTGKRVKVVSTVDGRDVLTGEKGGFTNAGGYVIDPHSYVLIDGFRQTDNTAAAFRFSSQKESYSGKKGTPENVGVIGVAAFREYERPRPKITRDRGLLLSSAPRRRHARGSGQGGAEEYSSGPIPVTHDASEVHGGEAASAGEEHERGITTSTSTRSLGFMGDEMLMEREREPSSPLGTKYGETVQSRVDRVSFRQVSGSPDQVITIHYDSLENLEARGIVETVVQESHHPDPFPDEPAVEPGYAQPPPK